MLSKGQVLPSLLFIFFLVVRSILLGKQSIECGTSRVVVAGGQESMSRSQHSAHLRDGVKFGEIGMADTMLKDGLTDAFHNFHMGITGQEGEGGGAVILQ